MRVQYMSDLHAEFMRDQGRSFFEGLPDTGADVLVLAGDIGVAEDESLFRILEHALARFAEVVYVAGNHEYYHSSPEKVGAALTDFCARHARFHWLNGSSVEISGQRFVGATLWFPDPGPSYPRANLYDNKMITDFEPWAYQEHERAVRYLSESVISGDVVVTHHLPSSWLIHPRWLGDPKNLCFASDSLSVDVIGRARAWIYGHTHKSREDTVGDTLLAVNPFGYARREENPDFDEACCFEISL